jgi:hypothetical protein
MWPAIPIFTRSPMTNHSLHFDINGFCDGSHKTTDLAGIGFESLSLVCLSLLSRSITSRLNAMYNRLYHIPLHYVTSQCRVQQAIPYSFALRHLSVPCTAGYTIFLCITSPLSAMYSRLYHIPLHYVTSQCPVQQAIPYSFALRHVSVPCTTSYTIFLFITSRLSAVCSRLYTIFLPVSAIISRSVPRFLSLPCTCTDSS